jgi:putative ABC transport system permease protein
VLTDLFCRLRALLRRGSVETELDQELRSHLEHAVEKYIQAGATPDEALRRARLEFGGFDGIKEECRAAHGVSFLETSFQDTRYALRMLRKNVGFTAVAILTLALGIGASTAVFSVVNAVLLKPLPYPHSEQIVFPWGIAPPGLNLGYSEIPWGRVQFLEFSRQTKTFQDFGAFKSDSFNLTGTGDPAMLEGVRASAEFFPALGVSPALGRTFTTEDDQPGHAPVVVLSHALWREGFGGDPAILGRVVELNGAAYTVIGVMPAGFDFPRANELPGSIDSPREAQLWVPLALNPGPIVRGEPSELAVIGRLKVGVTIEQAQAELDVFAKHMEDLFPRARGWFNSRVTPLTRQVAGDTRLPLLLMLGAVGIVLLVSCSNVASLLLARSLAREKEFSLRSALGAGRVRLIRQLLTESLLLAAGGAIAGIWIAELGIRLVKTFGPANIPRLREVSLDWRVFAFTFFITLLVGILFGLAPAFAAARQNLSESLKEGGHRTTTGQAGQKIRQALLVCEVALALVLVIAAGLLTRTFFRLLSIGGGFNPEHVLTFELSLPNTKYPDQDRIVTLYHQLLLRMQNLPGVESAGISEVVPLNGAGESTVVRIPGYHSADEKERPYANYTIVTPGYFPAIGTPVLQGRDFLETDTSDSMPVVIVNQAMARKFWPGQDPLGKPLGVPIRTYDMTIIGVVADMKHLSLREDPAPEMYVLYTQKPWPSMLLMQAVIRTKADPDSVMASVREAVHSLDSGLPLAKVTTLAAIVDTSLAQPRFSMLLLGSFGALSLLLASIGIFGVISYSVAQRTQEIGIRLALGAQRRNVFGMILSQGARLAGLGIGMGIVLALGVARLMGSFLFGVQPADPLTFAAVCVLLVGVAFLACYVPARRATRVDPLTALRYG